MADLDAYLDKFSDSGKRILQAALSDTHLRNQHFITPEHILSALIVEENDLFNETMQNLSIDPSVIQLAVMKRLKQSHQQDKGAGFRLSPEATEIFKYSMDRARSQHRRIIDAEDICFVLAVNKITLLDDILQNPEGSIPSIPSFSAFRKITIEHKPSDFHYQSQNQQNDFPIGSFVEFDGLLAVVIGLSGEKGVPDDHLALWFGEPHGKRISEGGSGNLVPIVWTVPIEHCLPAKPPVMQH
jgi:hypothetical protein